MPDHSRLLIAAFIIIFVSCKANPPGNDHQAPSAPGARSDSPRSKETLLHASWKHAFEEDTENIKVYKPADQNFAPARFRQVLTLNADKTCTGNTLQRNDAHTLAKGLWSWVNDSTISIKLGETPNDTLVIHHLSPGLLKVKK